jgi:hemolysin III
VSSAAKHYPPLEEKINVLSHAFGLLLSIVGLVLLIDRAVKFDGALPLVSFVIYGISLVVLYGASTCYHNTSAPDLRAKLRIVDHAAICVLIAGTYTPLTLVTLNGPIGWMIFTASWGLALAGIMLSLFFTGRYKILSTLIYVFMGWMIVFAIKPLMNSLDEIGLRWIIAGGLAYTLGAIIYAVKAIKFNHAIFHIFVLLGSFCHFMTIYFYVRPL